MLENKECGLDVIQEEAAMRTLDYYMTGNAHFGELSARGRIAQMYYFDDDGEKVYAPFLDYDIIKKEYGKIFEDIEGYNMWDFAVTMNLMYCKHHGSIKKWGKRNIVKKIRDLSVEFLNDGNTLHPCDKIWWYMSVQ